MSENDSSSDWNGQRKLGGLPVNKADFARMSSDELWRIYESVTEALAERIVAEKRELDTKLALLKQPGMAKPSFDAKPAQRQKRKYPKVFQKYRNPDDHSQTWSGRGKQPHWIIKLLKSGTKLDELIIPQYKKIKKAA